MVKYSWHSALLIVILLVLSSVCQAQEPPGIDLPPGELLQAMAWSSDTNIVLLVATDTGYGLRNIDLRSASVETITTPRSFQNIKPQQLHGGPHFFLSPRGNALAVLEDSGSPLKPHLLSLYKLSGTVLSDIPTVSIPDNFWTDHVAWDSGGDSLYLAAREYLDPDQTYSIGRFDLPTLSYKAVTLKANVDLINSLVDIDGRQAVIVRCKSYRGEYPLSDMLVLIDYLGNHQFLLHSQADQIKLNSLGDGRVLAFDPDNEQDGLWVLPVAGTELEAGEYSPAQAATIKANHDGSWLAYLEQQNPLRPEPPLLTLRRADGSRLETSVAVSSFEFSPQGNVMAAAGELGRRVYFFQLPGN